MPKSFAAVGATWWFAAALGYCAPSLPDSTVLKQVSLFAKSRRVIVEAAAGSISIPDSFVVAGSVRLWLGDKELPDSLYKVVLAERRIRLQTRPPADTLTLTYEVLPLRIPWRWRGLPYRRYRGEAAELPSPRHSSSARRRSLWTATPGLQQSGSVFRGVTVGTDQGLSLQSGLRMQLAGKVADKVEISASLTDQNTPLQPEGNTQTLQEIDKVFVQIRAPNVEATLGDYELRFEGGRFERYRRKLQGARLTMDLGPTRAIMSGAVSRGRFYTNEFLGQEGVQGPYQLRGEQGETDIIVLAGTERVWIDGVEMVRGEDRDYVIDYSTGELTFTRHRLITAESRIVVDFQYSDEKFRRNLYAVRLENQADHTPLRWRATYMRESDDRNNPVGFTLNEERLRALRAAGDHPDRAWVNGANYVGPGKGAYTLQDSVYKYVGSGKGDYQLSFSEVGEGKGDYRYRGAGVFEYVGPGSGRYLPVVALPLAQREEQFTVSGQLSRSENASVQVEVALSRHDRNLYSGLDDGDNLGLAGSVRAEVNPTLSRWGNFAWRAELRRVDGRFHDIHRTQQVEYDRRWDLSPSASRQEAVVETGVELNTRWGLATSANYGRIAKPEGFRCRRHDWQLEFTRSRWPTFRFLQENIRRKSGPQGLSGDWTRRRGEFRFQKGRWEPSLEYEGEDRIETSSDSLFNGFRFDRWRAGVNYRDPRAWTLGWYSELRRDDRKRRRAVEPYSESLTHGLRAQWGSGGPAALSLDLSHRERKYFFGQTPDTRTDLADVTLRLNPFRGAVRSSWHYQISNTQVARQERVFIKVEEGRGTYRYDPNFKEYVPDPYGDYILRVIPTDDYTPVVDLRAGAVLRAELQRFFPSRSGRVWRAIRQLSSESTFRVEEKTQYPRSSDIYLLRLSRFRDAQYTLQGTLLSQHDLYYRRGRRDGSVRLRIRRRESLSNQYLEGGQSSVGSLQSLLVQLAPWSPLALRLMLEQSHEKREFVGQFRPNRDILRRQGSLECSYRLGPTWELGCELRLGLGLDRVPEPDTKAFVFGFKPRSTVSIHNRGRFRAEAELVHLSARPEGRPVPYEMAGGLSAGTSYQWRGSFEYRVGGGMMASVQYTGRSDPFRPRTVHRFQAEIRAYF